MSNHAVSILDYCKSKTQVPTTKDDHTKASFLSSEAIKTCVDFLQRYNPPDRQTLKSIVYFVGRLLAAEARRQGVINIDGEVVYERKYALYNLELYNADLTKSEGFFADLEPLTEDQDNRLKGGRRSSVAIPNDLYKDFHLLKKIYRLNSDGDLVVHLIIVAATLLRLEQNHGLRPGVQVGAPLDKSIPDNKLEFPRKAPAK